MAGLCSSSSRWVQSWYTCAIFNVIYKVMYRRLKKLCKVQQKFGISICSYRQLFTLLHIRQISWRPSPRVGMSRKRNAWKKSENSSSTSLPLLMLFMRCTVSWMLILITQCDSKTLRFTPMIRLANKAIYILLSAIHTLTWLPVGHLEPYCGSEFTILCVTRQISAHFDSSVGLFWQTR